MFLLLYDIMVRNCSSKLLTLKERCFVHLTLATCDVHYSPNMILELNEMKTRSRNNGNLRQVTVLLAHPSSSTSLVASSEPVVCNHARGFISEGKCQGGCNNFAQLPSRSIGESIISVMALPLSSSSSFSSISYSSLCLSSLPPSLFIRSISFIDIFSLSLLSFIFLIFFPFISIMIPSSILISPSLYLPLFSSSPVRPSHSSSLPLTRIISIDIPRLSCLNTLFRLALAYQFRQEIGVHIVLPALL